MPEDLELLWWREIVNRLQLCSTASLLPGFWRKKKIIRDGWRYFTSYLTLFFLFTLLTLFTHRGINKNDGEIFVEQHLCCQALQKVKVKTNKNCQIGKKKHLSAPVRRHIPVTEFPYPGRRLFGFLQILVFLFVLRFFLFGQTICVYRLFACPGYLFVFMFFV